MAMNENIRECLTKIQETLNTFIQANERFYKENPTNHNELLVKTAVDLVANIDSLKNDDKNLVPIDYSDISKKLNRFEYDILSNVNELELNTDALFHPNQRENSFEYYLGIFNGIIHSDISKLVNSIIDLDKAEKDKKEQFVNRIKSRRVNAAKLCQTLSDRLDKPYKKYNGNITKAETELIEKNTYSTPDGYQTHVYFDYTRLRYMEDYFKLRDEIVAKSREVYNNIHTQEFAAMEKPADELEKYAEEVLVPELKNNIRTNAITEIERLGKELAATKSVFQNNSNEFNALSNAIEAFVNNKEACKNSELSLQKLMKGIVDAGQSYRDSHAGRAKLTGTMEKRLRIITRLTEITTMERIGIDPYSMEGQRRRLAEKLVSARFVKENNPGEPSRFVSGDIKKQIDDMLINPGFKKFFNKIMMNGIDKSAKPESEADMAVQIEASKNNLQKALSINGQKLLREAESYIQIEAEVEVDADEVNIGAYILDADELME